MPQIGIFAKAVAIFVIFCFVSNDDYNRSIEDEKYEIAMKKEKKEKAKIKRQYNELMAKGEFFTGVQSKIK